MIPDHIHSASFSGRKRYGTSIRNAEPITSIPLLSADGNTSFLVPEGAVSITSIPLLSADGNLNCLSICTEIVDHIHSASLSGRKPDFSSERLIDEITSIPLLSADGNFLYSPEKRERSHPFRFFQRTETNNVRRYPASSDHIHSASLSGRKQVGQQIGDHALITSIPLLSADGECLPKSGHLL